MNGYVTSNEKETLEKENYRKVLYTAKNSQLVLMTIQPGDEIGQETHDLHQFIRIEGRKALFTLHGAEHSLEDDWAVVIPAETEHDVVNTWDEPLRLYSICKQSRRQGEAL